MIVRPVRLSTRPNSANRTNSGITAVTMGRDCTTNNTNENPETNRLRPRDNTYPAGAATATDTTTVTTVTSMPKNRHQVPRASGSTFLRAGGATGGPTAVGFCEIAAVIGSAPS